MNRSRLTTVALSAVATLMSTAIAGAAAPVPAGGSSDAGIELRATESFNKGDFAAALPIFQKLETDLRSDPNQADKLSMVQEQIRVCQRNLTAPKAATAGGPTTAPAVASAAAGVTTERKPHPAPKDGEVLEMGIKDLGNFEYDPDQNTPIPDDVKALSGHMIRLHGYMIPMDQAENISKFALVPSLFNCCYGQPPQVQHTIVVTCPKGKAVSYYPDEIVVEGKLNVAVMKDDGFVVGIFAIDTTSVKPAAK
jgi:hypothetical protein